MSYRCAHCGRTGTAEPAATRGLGILAVHYGPTCARKLGFVRPKRARLFTPRRRRASRGDAGQGVLL